MAKSNSQGALHADPVIAKALAENARNGHKYTSAAELCRAVNIKDPNKQRAVRQVLRDAGQGVGRGRRYNGITAPKIVAAAKANSKRTKETTPKAKETPAKA